MNEGELWELCGHGWRLPIWAKLTDGAIEVKLAEVPLLKQMRETAESGLRTFCDRREGSTWYFSKKSLEQCASRSDRNNPEDVVVWRRPDDDKENPRADEFVKAYCESRHAPDLGLFKNLETAAVIWNSFREFMLEWLLFRQGEVDLGFAKLNAFCARVNWIPTILGRIVARRRNGVSKDTEETHREIRRLLHQDFITSCQDGRTLRWILHIEPARTFHHAAEVVEIKRKRQQRGSYAANVLKLLKSHGHKNRMYEALEDYWKETQIACAVLPRGFQPRLDADEKEHPLECQPAPKLIPTPVVEGGSMKDKSRFVSLDDASTLTADDLRRLSDGLNFVSPTQCGQMQSRKDEQ